jgi:Na+-translocating ferredoxin:NAD+ oxidoreductase RnfC subunit
MNRKEIIEKVKSAGVVGAGGGGFPTHVKIDAKVDTVIANGAECEPLLSTDRYIMETKAREIVDGLSFVKQTTGAKNLYVALKKKYAKAIEAFNKLIGMSSDIELLLLDNYYPAGDEFELVYNATGRIIPEGGIPLNVGTVVINVNSLLNIFDAVNKDRPVTKRWITVAGELAEPYMAEVPIGISIAELIEKGKPKIADYKILAGGPMMGKIVDKDFMITKLTSGVLVLPVDNMSIIKHSMNISVHKRRGSSMCDQCSDCTIVCPRNLLGHDLAPHMIMRNLFIAPERSVHLTNAYLCCECGLCNMFACPLDLSPRELLRESKRRLGSKGISSPHTKADLTPHPERDHRRVSQERLMLRLGVKKYDMHDFKIKNIDTDRVEISLIQHIGVSGKPIVKKGQEIKAGDLIADIPQGSLGAAVHSSIDGAVDKVSKDFITIII